MIVHGQLDLVPQGYIARAIVFVYSIFIVSEHIEIKPCNPLWNILVLYTLFQADSQTKGQSTSIMWTDAVLET